MTDAPTVDDLRDRFLDAQLSGDRREAVSLVTRARRDGALSTADIRAGVIRAAQNEIGRLWQQNRINVAQEHVATAISQLALAELFQHEPLADRNGRKAVVACVDGELHEFPARLAADELDVAGFDVRFLGASVPLEDLIAFVARENPDILVLSATMAFHADAVRDAVSQVRSVAPGLPIAVGGQVCQWVESLGGELGIEIFGGDAADLVRQAKALLDVA